MADPLVKPEPTVPLTDLEDDVAQCDGDCAALNPEIGECQPYPSRPRACRLARFLESLANTGALDTAAEVAGYPPGEVRRWLERGTDPDNKLYTAFLRATLIARGSSEEAVLVSAKAQALDDGRLGLAYLTTVHPDRYNPRQVATGQTTIIGQQNVFPAAEQAKALREFAVRNELVESDVIDAEFEAEDDA